LRGNRLGVGKADKEPAGIGSMALFIAVSAEFFLFLLLVVLFVTVALRLDVARFLAKIAYNLVGILLRGPSLILMGVV
jgi:hypothetical protein